MINQTIKVYVKKLRLFITILLWSILVPSKVYTFQIKLYNKLDLESLEFRWWFRKLCLFFRIKKTGLPEYLFNMIPQGNHT